MLSSVYGKEKSPTSKILNFPLASYPDSQSPAMSTAKNNEQEDKVQGTGRVDDVNVMKTELTTGASGQQAREPSVQEVMILAEKIQELSVMHASFCCLYLPRIFIMFLIQLQS